jgi:hypothetical protein
MSEETRNLMSLKKSGENNPLYGKTHSEETKDLMRQKPSPPARGSVRALPQVREVENTLKTQN